MISIPICTLVQKLLLVRDHNDQKTMQLDLSWHAIIDHTQKYTSKYRWKPTDTKIFNWIQFNFLLKIEMKSAVINQKNSFQISKIRENLTEEFILK